jgi:hypothetical protein
MVMEVLGEGRGEWKWMELWALTLASIAGYGHPSLGRGGVVIAAARGVGAARMWLDHKIVRAHGLVHDRHGQHARDAASSLVHRSLKHHAASQFPGAPDRGVGVPVQRIHRRAVMAVCTVSVVIMSFIHDTWSHISGHCHPAHGRREQGQHQPERHARSPAHGSLGLELNALPRTLLP